MIGNFSAYDFLTNFVPGAVFAALATMATEFSFVHPDPIVSASLYFFFGMIISRIGSLIVQPSIEFVGLTSKGSYEHYLLAEKCDPKVQTMSEVRNLYRSMLTCHLVVLPFILIWPNPNSKFPIPQLTIFLSASLLVFLFSFRKQSNFLEARIKFAIRKEKEK